MGVSDGVVKYELTNIDYVIEATGGSWNRLDYVKGIKAQGTGIVEGTILAQLISDRKLKVEVFPGKLSSDVSGFTTNAVMYER